MKIELRKVSHSKSLSEETPAYTAQVWVDGVHFCDVSNHGQGGGDCLVRLGRGKSTDDIIALNERCKAELPKWKSEWDNSENETDLELWCHLELGRIDLEKTVKRDLANKVLFVKPDGKLYQINTKKASVDRKVELIAKLRNEGHKVLNEMTLAEAVKVYETAGA